ncbi:MAG: glycosyltransferase [Pseudomonadota bacterium]
MNPLISVVIPVYNRPEPAARAVESVLAQTHGDFELIVVDDGSTDGTWEVLRSFGDRIKALRRPRRGVSAARNAGLAASTGSLIAFLDSDDYWAPEKLSAQELFFRENPQALICQTEEIWIRDGRRVNPKKRHGKPSGQVFYRSLELCLISPSAVMMRRELFDLVGTFDETLPACEDYDLWLRVSARTPVFLIDRPLVFKTGGHADQLSRTTVGLDQYRVRALEKILESGILTPRQRAAAGGALFKKALVFAQGCLKRGRLEESRRFLDLAEKYRVIDGEGPGEG